MNSDPQFEQAVWNLLDGNLREEEFNELQSSLLQSDEERERFLKIVELHGSLHQKLGHDATEPSVVSMEEVTHRQRLRIFKRSALAAAAVLLLSGILMSSIWLKKPEPLLTFQHTKDAVFDVTHDKQDDTSKDLDELTIGSRLQLTQGTMELTLKNGVQAIVRAPADLILQKEDRIVQSAGVVRYVVPTVAAGFQVQTQDLIVTDLGTEFGIVSSPNEPDQVHLFKGKVEIESRKPFKAKELLTEVESRIIGQMGHLKPIDSSPELFKTSLEEKLPYLHLSFDQREGETLEIGGNLLGLEEISAKVTKGKELPVLTPGQFGNAMQFNGQGGYVQTNWEGVSGSAPRSVAFWCKLPKSSDSNTTQDACGFVAWGNQRVYGSKFVIVINRDSDAGKLGAIRFDCGQGYAIGESKLTDGEWHHVAVVMAGEVDPSLGMDVQVYVDGERETLTGFRPNTPDTTPGTNNNSWMSVGRYRLPGMSFHKTLTGTLDELYVFPSFLTRSDVQQIMNGDW